MAYAYSFISDAVTFIGHLTAEVWKRHSAPATFANTLWKQRKTPLATFLALLSLCFVPIWRFDYIPTEIGPASVYSAVVLNKYHSPGTRYNEFFDIKVEQLPNWTTFLLIAGLIQVVPPLVAEKLCLSICIAGFALSFRYFLTAFDRRSEIFAPACFLFVFSRCFLMGFYNYCLSLTFFWVVLGYCLRRRHRFTNAHAIVLALLLLVTYFTHLFGWGLAACSAMWVVSTSAQPATFVRALVATLPSAVLAVSYFVKTGFWMSDTGQLLQSHWQSLGWNSISCDLQRVNEQLFKPYEGPVPLGLLVSLLYAFLLLVDLVRRRQEQEGEWQVLLLGGVIALGYFVLPDSLLHHGGFIKARLPVILALALFGCLRAPAANLYGRLLHSTIVALVCLNLLAVQRHFRGANEEIEEFVAGIRYTGQNRTIYVVHAAARRPLVDHLRQASGYYCLTTGNISLDNYQAEQSHFPVRFRSNVERGRGTFFEYIDRNMVDYVIVWDAGPRFRREMARFCQVKFHKGRLSIFENSGAADVPADK